MVNNDHLRKTIYFAASPVMMLMIFSVILVCAVLLNYNNDFSIACPNHCYDSSSKCMYSLNINNVELIQSLVL